VALHPRPDLRRPGDPLVPRPADDLPHREVLAVGIAPVQQRRGDPDFVGDADEGHGGSSRCNKFYLVISLHRCKAEVPGRAVAVDREHDQNPAAGKLDHGWPAIMPHHRHVLAVHPLGVAPEEPAVPAVGVDVDPYRHGIGDGAPQVVPDDPSERACSPIRTAARSQSISSPVKQAERARPRSGGRDRPSGRSARRPQRAHNATLSFKILEPNRHHERSKLQAPPKRHTSIYPTSHLDLVSLEPSLSKFLLSLNWVRYLMKRARRKTSSC